MLPENVEAMDNLFMTSKDVLFHIPSVVDDRTPLPQYQGFNRQKFILDLRDLKLMNSVGIRAWVHWIRSFHSPNEVRLVNCPVIFLNIASIVSDVVPNGVRIDSMILRYVNEESGATLRCLLQRPTTDTWRIPETLTHQGQTYEFDGILSKTLGRLKGETELLETMAEADLAASGLQVLTQD
ncbi:MAG: hypothetical protein KF767_18945 [Bdellovibrionaceae bacterium]|nr:hypothetical protein [Pseudobdellovibrionaceae bacterium]